MASTDTTERGRVPSMQHQLGLPEDLAPPKPIYTTVLVKCSGNALAGNARVHDPDVFMAYGRAFKTLTEMKVNVVVIVGGSNIVNGEAWEKIGLDRAYADHLGMQATGINGGLLWATLQFLKVPSVHMSMVAMEQIAEPWVYLEAHSHKTKGKVIIVAGGTGNPYCTTDSAASLKAMEMGCDLVLSCKDGVDAIYDSDPKTNPEAQRIERIPYMDVITQGLGAMDLNAVNDCMQKQIPIRVIGAADPQNIIRAVIGEEIGTLIH